MFWRRLWYGNVEWQYPMRWVWERLTVTMLRQGYGELYMRHFLATEFSKLCDDPVMAKKIGVERNAD